MKKIPTIFERDWNGDRSRVLDKPHPDCAWVFAGEGVATRKLDGTSCMVRDGKLFKRYELRAGKTAPQGFEVADHDAETGKTTGWVPVGGGPEDRYHRDAWNLEGGYHDDGTYELVGPKVQGNPERFSDHILIAHDDENLRFGRDGSLPPPCTFDMLRFWLSTQDVEGVVWHHADGRMAKIKKRDFGLPRKPTP